MSRYAGDCLASNGVDRNDHTSRWWLIEPQLDSLWQLTSIQDVGIWFKVDRLNTTDGTVQDAVDDLPHIRTAGLSTRFGQWDHKTDNVQMTEPIDVHTAVLMLETKLRRPTVSTQHVARPRLLEQLNASADRQLILVSAPAGYGKTALVSRWLDAVDCPCAWFSVDEHDDDLAAFLLYLVAAIRAVYHDAMGAIELLLQAPTLLAPHRLADALLQDLAALPGPFILAFDDYHTVNAPAIHALMARLVERLPAQVHLVLITRADPPLPLVRLRGRQQLGEIRAADLRFSAEETGLLLQQLLGSGVTAETAALLEESTEGWAVGLHLAALSLRNRTDPAAFARQIAAQGHQAITEYLLSEVLADLPAAQRDCLLQSALFERFCAPLIDAAQAEGDGKLAGDDFLRAIRRANLFVVLPR